MLSYDPEFDNDPEQREVELLETEISEFDFHSKYDWNDPYDYPGIDYEDEEPDYVPPPVEVDLICNQCDGTGEFPDDHMCKICSGKGRVDAE